MPTHLQAWEFKDEQGTVSAQRVHGQGQGTHILRVHGPTEFAPLTHGAIGWEMLPGGGGTWAEWENMPTKQMMQAQLGRMAREGSGGTAGKGTDV